MTIRKAVVLAAGRGTRMRRADKTVALSADQERAAKAGAKAMMPVSGERPFLDYVLSALADAGLRDVCLVVAPSDNTIRDRYELGTDVTRLNVVFAEQTEPRGTADALLAARDFAGDEPFIMLNSDNLYSVAVLSALAETPAPALVGYDAAALVLLGNIPIDRVRSFAFIRTDDDGVLTDIVEKPDPVTAASFGMRTLVSMNLWSFTSEIFDACERVTPSPRNELELVDAVRISMKDLDVSYEVIRVQDGVLDLSGRGDVAAVAKRLEGVRVQL